MIRHVRSLSRSWSQVEPERRNAILLLAGIGALLALAFAVLAYGFVTSRSAASDTVIAVGDRKFDYTFMERRAKAELLRGRLDTQNLAQSILDVIVAVEREEVTRLVGAKLGVGLTEDEIEKEMRRQIGVNAEAPRAEFAARLRAELLRLGLPYGEYRDIVKADIIQDKLLDRFAAAVPAETDFVDLRLLKADTLQAAQSAKRRIDDGEDLRVVAAQVSTHPSKGQAGQLGWVPKGSQLPEIEEKAFSMPLDTPSELIEAQNAFWIIQVAGRETRAVDEAAKAQIVEQSLDREATAMRQEVGSRLMLTQDQLQRLALTIRTGLG